VSKKGNGGNSVCGKTQGRVHARVTSKQGNVLARPLNKNVDSKRGVRGRRGEGKGVDVQHDQRGSGDNVAPRDVPEGREGTPRTLNGRKGGRTKGSVGDLSMGKKSTSHQPGRKRWRGNCADPDAERESWNQGGRTPSNKKP